VFSAWVHLFTTHSSTSSKKLDANNLQGLSGKPLSRERELMVVRPGSAGEDLAGMIMKVWLGAEQKVNTLLPYEGDVFCQQEHACKTALYWHLFGNEPKNNTLQPVFKPTPASFHANSSQ
jgi:hypothetical protein